MLYILFLKLWPITLRAFSGTRCTLQIMCKKTFLLNYIFYNTRVIHVWQVSNLWLGISKMFIGFWLLIFRSYFLASISIFIPMNLRTRYYITLDLSKKCLYSNFHYDAWVTYSFDNNVYINFLTFRKWSFIC